MELSSNFVRSFIFSCHKYKEIALEDSQDFSTNIGKLLNYVGLYQEAIHLEKQLSIVAEKEMSISETVMVKSVI